MVARGASNPSTSRPAAASILLVFAGIVIVCLALPVVEFIDMVSHITSGSQTVEIDKGVYYLLGVGVALAFLLIDGFYNTIIRRPISTRLAKVISRTAIAGLVLIVALPVTVHYSTEYVLLKKDYRVCEEESSQWLFVRDIVYAQPGHCG